MDNVIPEAENSRPEEREKYLRGAETVKFAKGVPFVHCNPGDMRYITV